jgi:hypothetical protein
MSLMDRDVADDLRVIEAATPGLWSISQVDDDMSMNAFVIHRAARSGKLNDHTNNIAVVLLQSPRYADVDDGNWHDNADFIVRARSRQP